MNKFDQYANHYNRLYSNHNSRIIKHTIDIDRMKAEMESFYAMNPQFYVEDCNMITRLLNEDYNKYIEWIVDD